MCVAKYYTTLNIRDAYNLLRIAEGDEWKTAFRTRWGLFETLIVPFGLTNAPAAFQHYINDVLRPFLDIFCSAYLDDVLIYSSTLNEHKTHVRVIIETLAKAGLYLNLDKCKFYRQEVSYLGFIVFNEGLAMNPEKIKAITE